MSREEFFFLQVLPIYTRLPGFTCRFFAVCVEKFLGETAEKCRKNQHGFDTLSINYSFQLFCPKNQCKEKVTFPRRSPIIGYDLFTKMTFPHNSYFICEKLPGDLLNNSIIQISSRKVKLPKISKLISNLHLFTPFLPS